LVQKGEPPILKSTERKNGGHGRPTRMKKDQGLRGVKEQYSYGEKGGGELLSGGEKKWKRTKNVAREGYGE